MSFKSLLQREARTCRPSDTAGMALTKMQAHRLNHLVVAQEGRVFGILSERDLTKAQSPYVPVLDLMSARSNVLSLSAANQPPTRPPKGSLD
jgi:CBS domain-containing protein